MSTTDTTMSDYTWNIFLKHALPTLKSISIELKILSDCLEEKYIQVDEPLPPDSRDARFMSKFLQVANRIDEVMYEAQNDTILYGQNFSQQLPHSQGGYSGHQQFQQPNAMATQHQQTPYCSLCYGEDYPHPTHNCNLFPTPYEKRCELIHMGSCPNCTRQHHQQEECPSHLSCIYHPGERHYTWLCPGQAASVPL